MSKNNAAQISHFHETTTSQNNRAKSLKASSLKHSANSLSGPPLVHFYSSVTGKIFFYTAFVILCRCM